jgi:ribosomal protein L14
LEPHGRKYAKVGDVILVSVIETVKSVSANTSQIADSKKSITASATPSKQGMVKGTMSKALVVRTKCHSYKNMANYDDNAVILIKSNPTNTKKNLGITPVASRIKGPISNILKLNPSSPIYPSLNLDNDSVFGFVLHSMQNKPLNKSPKVKLGEAAIQYQKILALSKLHY